MWIKRLCSVFLWLLDLQLKWTQRNKEFWTKHQREKFKIGAASRPISYSQISPSAAESLQELVASGPMRAGKRWGVGGLLLLPGCTSFIFLISGGGVLSPRTWRSGTQPEPLTRKGGGGVRRRREGGGGNSQSQQDLSNWTLLLIYHPHQHKPLWDQLQTSGLGPFLGGGWDRWFRSVLSKTGSDSDLNRKCSAPSADIWPENIRICSETDAFYTRKGPMPWKQPTLE